MSSFNVNLLPSATDERIPSFLRRNENGTTAAIRHDTILEFGLLAKGARIINNDSLNNLEVFLHDRNNVPFVIPPNSEIPIQEWFSEIHVVPDAVTGDFQLTLELLTDRK